MLWGGYIKMILFLIFYFITSYIKYNLFLFGIISQERVTRKVYIFIVFSAALLGQIAVYKTGGSLEAAVSICQGAVFLLMLGKMKQIRIDVLFTVHIVIWFLNEMIQAFIVYFFKTPLETVRHQIFYGVLTCIISCFIILLITILVKKRYRGEEIRVTDISEKRAGVVCLLMIGLGGYFAGMQYELVSRSDFYHSFWVLCWSAISIIIAIVILFAWLVADQSSRINKERYDVQKKLFKKQSEYYQKLLDRDEEIRKIRHEVKNHMRVLKKLLADQSYGELRQYIDSWKQPDSYFSRSMIYTGNKIVDIIVNDICGDISVEWTGEIPEGFCMETPDICVLFSNLFENARDAVLKLEENRLIEVVVKNHGKNLFIQIINPVGGDISLLEKGEFRTDKEDKERHGYGLKNVKDVIDKYSSTIDFEVGNGKVTVSLFLQNLIEIDVYRK